MNELERINYLLTKSKRERLTYVEYRDLQYFLIKYYVYFSNNYPVCESYLDDERVMYIADTQIGSEYENKIFIDSAYNYAIANNIKNVIHLGDFVEGTCRHRDRTREELWAEGAHAFSMLPSEVKTKLLFGNHDFSVFSHSNRDILDEFFKSDRLDVLGLGRVMLNHRGVNIKLNHYISDKLIRFADSEKESVITLEGHSHFYASLDNRRIIKVPSLSNELKDMSYYDKQNLAKFGLNLELLPPYLNFIVSSFVSEDSLLFEEMREEHNYIKAREKTLVNIKDKSIKVYKS